MRWHQNPNNQNVLNPKKALLLFIKFSNKYPHKQFKKWKDFNVNNRNITHVTQGHMLLMVNKFPKIQYSAMAV